MTKKIITIFIFLFSLGLAQDTRQLEGALFDDTMLRLEGSIKECVRKQNIYAHNIANAKTPGYKPIRFADELEELRQRPDFQEDVVNVEEEMAKMTKNKFKHQTFLRLYNMKMQVLKKVITQGKG